jgi:hypothetical protein
MEWLKGIGLIGFMFFFIKGLLWIVVFLLIWFGLINKERVEIFKARIKFWKRASK